MKILKNNLLFNELQSEHERRLVRFALSHNPGNNPDATSNAPELREEGDPTHKAEQAMDKIARLSKTIDDLHKHEAATGANKATLRKIHNKLSAINDRLNDALGLNDESQEKVISETLTELNNEFANNAELSDVKDFAVNAYAKKLNKLFEDVGDNPDYQKVYENMTGMFSLMNEGENVSIMGADFKKEGTKLHVKMGNKNITYDFHIYDGDWKIVNTKQNKEEGRYTPKRVAEMKKLSEDQTPGGEQAPGIPNSVTQYVADCKKGVKDNVKLMQYMNPPNQFVRNFCAAVDPNNPTKGVKKMTVLRNRLQEFGDHLEYSSNYMTAEKFEENIVKKLVSVITENTPNQDIAQTVGAKFPQTETQNLIASYKKEPDYPTATDVSFNGGGETVASAPKFKSLVRSEASQYVANLDSGNGFKLTGVEDKQIQQILDTPSDKRVSITIVRENGQKEEAQYHPNFKNYISQQTGDRIRIHDGDTVTIDAVTPLESSPKEALETKTLKELQTNLNEMSIGEDLVVNLDNDHSLELVKVSDTECSMQVDEGEQKVVFKIGNEVDLRTISKHIIEHGGQV